MGVIAAIPGHHVRIAAVVAEPGAVERSGKAVVLALAVSVARRSDAPLRQHAADALGIQRSIEAQLEIMVMRIEAVRAAELSVPHPCPQAGSIFFLFQKPQVPHPLPQGIQAFPIETVSNISGADQRHRIPVDLLFHFGQIPFLRCSDDVPLGILYRVTALDGRRHIPQAAPVEGLARKHCIFAGIRHEQQIFDTGHFFAARQAGILDLDGGTGPGFRLADDELIPVFFRCKIRLHVQGPALSFEGIRLQRHIGRAGFHIDPAALPQFQSAHPAVPGHVPEGAVRYGEVRFGCIHTGFARKG